MTKSSRVSISCERAHVHKYTLRPRTFRQPRPIFFKCQYFSKGHFPKSSVFRDSSISKIKQLSTPDGKILLFHLNKSQLQVLFQNLSPSHLRFQLNVDMDELSELNLPNLKLDTLRIVGKFKGEITEIDEIVSRVTNIKLKVLYINNLYLSGVAYLFDKLAKTGLQLRKLKIWIEQDDLDPQSSELFDSIAVSLCCLKCQRIKFINMRPEHVKMLKVSLDKLPEPIIPVLYVHQWWEQVLDKAALPNLIVVSGFSGILSNWKCLYIERLTIFRRSNGPFGKLSVDLRRELVKFCYDYF